MSTTAKLAFRNLNRQKKRSFLLGGAIAFGIFVVTLINSLAGSLQGNLAANMAQLNAGHLFVQGVEKNSKDKPFEIVRDDALLSKALEESGIAYVSVSRRSYTEGSLVFSGKRQSQGVYGVNFALEPTLKERIALKSGSWDRIEEEGSIVLSEGVVKKMKLELDDRVQFTMKTATGQNNVGDFRLIGVAADLGAFGDMLAYTNQAYLNKLLNIGPTEYDFFSVMLPDLQQAEGAAVAYKAALKKRAQVFELSATDLAAKAKSGMAGSRYMKLQKLAKSETWKGAKYRVCTINDTISQVEDLAGIIKLVSFIILLILFLIIMVGITNTFRMIMYERIKEIGTMRAVGMQRKSVRNLFLSEAAFLATGGTLAGWILAAFVLTVASLFNLGTENVFSLFLKNGHLTPYFPIVSALLDYLLVLILTLVAAFMPARRAARLEPAAALRSSK